MSGKGRILFFIEEGNRSKRVKGMNIIYRNRNPAASEIIVSPKK